MRKSLFPHAVRGLSACLAFLFGALIFQGCGDDTPQPYAALDEAFPEGRPLGDDVATRMADKQYVAQLKTAMGSLSEVSDRAAKAKAEAEHFRSVLVGQMREKLGAEPPEALVEATLARNDHYQSLLKAQAEAEAAVVAQQQKNLETVRARLNAPAAKYDAMRAEADAAAQAAGLPVRPGAPVTP